MEPLFPRERFLDPMGRPRTLSLFLEPMYEDEYALYTLKEVDYEYKGKQYLSIKRLYLEIADPTEYEFAKACFVNWRHWKKISEIKAIKDNILEWRDDLDQSLRSFAVRQMYESAKTGNYQAAKWFADRSWDNRGAGRPSKKEIDGERKFQAKIDEEYGEDAVRLFKIK